MAKKEVKKNKKESLDIKKENIHSLSAPVEAKKLADAPKSDDMAQKNDKEDDTELGEKGEIHSLSAPVEAQKSADTPESDNMEQKNDKEDYAVLGEKLMHLMSIESTIGFVCERYEKCIDSIRGTSVIPGAMEKFLQYNGLHTAIVEKIEKTILEDKWLKAFSKE